MFYHWRWRFIDGKLKIQDIHENGTKLLIDQVCNSVRLQTIGMKLEPALEFHDATQFILEKIHKFMTGMSGSTIYPSDANTAYRVFFTSAVYYGVEAISLSKSQK